VLLPDDVRARLADAAAALRRAAPDVAWVAAENLHLTLKFLGPVDEARLPAIVAALTGAAAGQPRFVLDCVGLGAFPSASRPRVVWAGVERGAAAVAALARAVEGSLEPLGFAPESRTFTAHVTLGRIRDPRRRPALTAALSEGAARPFGAASVERLSLMRSQLHPHGARYTELAACALGAP
jgi:RNA 2',3'-cyclic 3'-phosphodiesterase